MNTVLWKNQNQYALEVAQRVKKRRKERGYTQLELSKRSGVSYGSIKRFEQTGEISFVSLIKLALAMDCGPEFDNLFRKRGYRSIQEIIDEHNR